MKNSRPVKFEVYKSGGHFKHSALPLPQTSRSRVSIQELDEETVMDYKESRSGMILRARYPKFPIVIAKINV